ncbi:MAG: zf-HC2 domain-containing protein, partial [Thermomicrobiaceae bacterium]|nr:zf-HC2 domain-containing protein [Thermomicrobiaceae bacterium]
MGAIGSGWDGEHPDDALLSAYLDGEVEDAATRDAVRRHLAG